MKFRLINSAAYYVLLQRTELHSNIYKTFHKFGKNTEQFYLDNLLKFDIKRRLNFISDEYINIMNNELETFIDYIPKKNISILDIGCGISGLDFALFNNKNVTVETIDLLDKSGVSEELYYGFEANAANYNSLIIAKENLISNGIPSEKIFLTDINTDKFPVKKFDLIVSIISWGFHYPVSTYIKEAYESLSENGRVILDIRNETDGYEVASKYFHEIELIFKNDKYSRYCLKRK